MSGAKVEQSDAEQFGCLVGMWSMLVTTPMWLALMFATLAATNPPVWAWVLYWCYLPAQLAQVIAVNLFKIMKERAEKGGAK